ncbi:hypothetical protein M1Q10_09450 [Pseudomonas aeruginosa]|uniref:hypothetical protein n=1 Tax=Pseudomonas aeruginosa TaxID=287 RepID=UPI00200ED066|nr:hypothetical protein [Pseudomonas aeruginosa]UPZ07379.1 hypothetical protein M1Q10_09450 [Pseudomonas aeruginosa]
MRRQHAARHGTPYPELGGERYRLANREKGLRESISPAFFYNPLCWFPRDTAADFPAAEALEAASDHWPLATPGGLLPGAARAS